jgi:E3 ubiquitin-protein ligase HERC2
MHYARDATLVCLSAGTVNISLLRNQQQRLAAMNACSVLFRHQNLLRHVLKHHTLGSSPSLEVLNEGEELDPISETLLIKKLISKATEPSPLKAIFGKSDIEVSCHRLSLLKILFSYPYTG